KNKGSINVESQVGEGTRFLISIPRANPGQSAHRKQTELKAADTNGYAMDFWEEFPMEKLLQLNGKKVLIVDDSPEQRMFLKTLLSDIFEIIEAENGQQGIQLAIEKRPVAIISDVMMPEVNGIEFCKMVRSNA